jgi:hypothetical protein
MSEHKDCPICDDREALMQDNRRLRGLVKDAEAKGAPNEFGSSADEPTCPWCGEQMHIAIDIGHASRSMRGQHVANCPAFTPDGTPR